MSNEMSNAETPARRFDVSGHDWRMLIGGDLIPAASGDTISAVNPATRETIAAFPSGGPRDVDAAVEAANAAFPEWSRLPITERAQHVMGLVEAIEAHGEELAHIDTLENGSPLRVMRGDFRIASEQLRFFANLGIMLRGETIPTDEHDSVDFTMRSPFGVVARIVPFNHPLMFAASKLAAPLMAGNTVVLKPSQHTSLSALRLGELCAETLPPGVVNILTGSGSAVGDPLVRHPDVPRIALTGSVSVGRRIQQRAASERVKVVTLELGGKNPILVFDDADRDEAIEGVIRGMNFTWQGQSCGSTSRLYVHRPIFHDFVSELANRMEALVVGDPFDSRTDVGAVVSKQQYDSVVRYIDQGIQTDGLKLLTGGRPSREEHTAGYFVPPTLFTAQHDVDPLFVEEIFGPVLVASPFDTEEEVVGRANALPLGLTASIWTKDLGRAMRISRDIQTGYMWVNWSSTHIPGAPFGGVKDSGVGREEGIEELYSYSQTKNIYLRF